MSGPLDLVVVGDIDVDIFLRVPRLPTAGEKIRGRALGIFPGGVAANVAVAARRLGLRSGVHGVIGDDQHGRLAREALEREGVSLDGLIIDAGATTFFCVVQLDDTGDKALTMADTGCLFPRTEQLDEALLTSARHVHVAPFELAAATEAVTIARRAGGTTSADLEPGSISGGLGPLSPLLAALDVCFVNHHAAHELSPSGDPTDAIAALHAHGPRCVVLTTGAAGTTVSVDGAVTVVPGVPAHVVDTTGAGDAFCAAFLAEWARGQDEISAARAAVMAGALACASIGAQTGAPTRAALSAALAEAAASPSTLGPTPTSPPEPYPLETL